jgi:predicted phosphoribosyltransferase
MIHLFTDRRDAGQQLADRLVELGWHRPPLKPDLLLGLARGGVAVARPVAEELEVPWSVLVVRKIGAPDDPELGVGAICEDGVPLLSKGWLRRLDLRPEDLAAQVIQKQRDLNAKIQAYRGHPLFAPKAVRPRLVCVVDDGLATGVSAEAAARYLRREGVKRLLLAVPVAAPDSQKKLQNPGQLYDQVVSLESPSAFGSVGSWYQNFEPVTDSEVLTLLQKQEPIQKLAA